MVTAGRRIRGGLYTLSEMGKSPINETVLRWETMLRLLACPVCHAGLAHLDEEAVQCTGWRTPLSHT